MLHKSALRESLLRLYSEASGFRISIDIIVKLAKCLNLDTFVDTDEFPGVTRLSIAGSLLLLEIDFKDESTVSNVSLSLGNHSLETRSDQGLSDDSTTSDVAGIKENGRTVILSYLPEHRASFLRTRHELLELSSSLYSIAERIILSSLEGPKLGLFPKNLKYLADLDRVSPPEGDLIIYIENLATYLAAIHRKECTLNPGDWQIERGLQNSIGKITFNDQKEKHVGVFLQFWQDSRVINYALETEEQPQVGKSYSALLAIEASNNPATDYLLKAKLKHWHIQTPSGEKIPYIFRGETDVAHLHKQQSVTADSNWKLVLRFVEPISFSRTYLEYLGISDYECAKLLDLETFWDDISESGEIRFRNAGSEYLFVFDEYSPHINLQAVSLDDIHTLEELIPALRNQIVFNKILESVALDKNSEYLTSSEHTRNEEAKQKIRESLQLSSNVPDAELLGLNTMSSDYMGVPMIDGDIELGDFIKSESDRNDSLTQDDFDESAPENLDLDKTQLEIKFLEACYGSAESNFVVRILGHISGPTKQTVDTDIQIQNGQMKAVKHSEDVDMVRETDVSQMFVQSLALSEDIILALQGLGSEQMNLDA